MANVIFVFGSNAGTMIATKALRDGGVDARLVPTPSGVQSAANLCLSIDVLNESKAISALQSANASPSSVVR